MFAFSSSLDEELDDDTSFSFQVYVGSLCLALLFLVARLFLLAFVWAICLFVTLLTTTKTSIVIGIKIIRFLVSIPIFVVVLVAVPLQEFAKLSG